MALNTRPPKPPGGGGGGKRPDPSDEAIDRVMSKAPDYRGETAVGEGRAGKGRAKGKGFAMGNKRQITHMITDELLDEVDEEAKVCGEARAVVINRFIREGLARSRAARAKLSE